MAELTRDETREVREAVRDRYAHAATEAEGCCGPADCCGSTPSTTTDCFGPTLYGEDDRESLPEAAFTVSLGCGNPTAMADLHEGDVVLDLGSGGGADVLISARRVGPTGKVYGLDMTDEMLELARANASEAGIGNVEWLKGYIEDIPLADETVDVVLSNCVINLSTDKARVLREAARVLRPGGRFAVTDIVADEAMPSEVRADMEQWTGCVAGALTQAEFVAALEAAGFEQIELAETHRVHEYAGSAVLRARKPRSGQRAIRA